MLHHEITGAGPVVVLSHALGCDLGMWDEVAASLRGHFTVVRYDQRGHGRSPAPPGPFGIDELADDAAELIAALGRGPVHFAGLSMGGMVGQALAARHPRLVQSLVIANSAAQYDEAARAMWQARIRTVGEQGMEAIADGALQRWFTPEFAARAPQRLQALRDTLVRTDADAYARSCQAVAGIGLLAGNARIDSRTLVVAGSRDEATPPAMSTAIAGSIPGAELVTLDAAHLSAVEQPQAFTDLLRRFWSHSLRQHMVRSSPASMN